MDKAEKNHWGGGAALKRIGAAVVAMKIHGRDMGELIDRIPVNRDPRRMAILLDAFLEAEVDGLGLPISDPSSGAVLPMTAPLLVDDNK